jgi:hypothetical protein
MHFITPRAHRFALYLPIHRALAEIKRHQGQWFVKESAAAVRIEMEEERNCRCVRLL